MKYDGYTVGDRLFKQRQIGNGSLKGVVAESFMQASRIGALILANNSVARNDVAQQLETGVVSLLNMLERFDDVIRAERAPLCRFERNQQEVRGTEGRIGDERNVRRAVEQDVIVERRDFAQWIDQRRDQPRSVPLGGIGNVELFECEAAGNRIDATEVAGADEGLNLRIDGRIEKSFGTRPGDMLAQQRGRDIPLLVEIDHQAAFAPLLADPGDQPAEVRLADASFEIERRDDPGRSLGRCTHGGERSTKLAA